MARSKQLLINSIVCYNYLYQTQKLSQANPEERKEIQKALSQSAAFTYKHINFHGEYDFSHDAVKNTLRVDLDDSFDLEEMN